MLYTLGSQLTEREGTTEDGPPPSEEQYLEFPMYDVRNKLTSVTSATVVFPLAKSVQTLLHDDNIDISLVDRLCNLIKRSRVIWKSKMGCHKIVLDAGSDIAPTTGTPTFRNASQRSGTRRSSC
jgi:hypothetical protein